MIFLDEPANFNPKIEVASCFVEHDGKILLLLRQDNKMQGNTWGVPAGKIDPGETPEIAITREIREETGIKVSDLEFYRKIFVRYADYDFLYYMFRAKLRSCPEVVIDAKAHKDFRWIEPKNALSLPLIEDEDACIKMFYTLET